MTKQKDNNFIKLNDVRLSYPSIFQPKVWANSNATAKYEATFILDKVKHLKEINAINNRIDELVKLEKINRNKIKEDHLCLKDGDLTDKEEYKNAFTLKTKTGRKFPIVNKDAETLVTAEEGLFYGGCYVSAYIDLWCYTNPAIGIGANLKSIQFRKHGEPFDGGEQDITGAFDPIEDDSEEDIF